MSFFVIGLAMLVNVAALLIAEYQGDRARVWRSKPLASVGFVLASLAVHAFSTAFGVWMFVALVLGAIGDVLLIPKRRDTFLAGLGSFLLGHLAFTVAFTLKGFHLGWALAAGVLVTLIAAGVWKWLGAHVTGSMRGPVIAYIAVISSMVVTAAGCVPERPVILFGAVLFFLSDLAVARDRFVKREFMNKAWGLPAYYTAQIVMAWSAQP